MSDTPEYNIYTVSDELNETIRSVLVVLGDLEFNHQVDLMRIDQDLEHKETREVLWKNANIAHQWNIQPFVMLLSRLKMQQKAHGPEEVARDHKPIELPDALLRVDPVQHKAVLNGERSSSLIIAGTAPAASRDSAGTPRWRAGRLRAGSSQSRR